jgi:hypothetical protein
MPDAPRQGKTSITAGTLTKLKMTYISGLNDAALFFHEGLI